MTMDANVIDEVENRRAQLVVWLLRAWDWASDHKHPVVDRIAELISHAEEPDYPLFEQATRWKIIGDSRLAEALRKECGVPVRTPVAGPWEAGINYSPVITLEESAYRQIHGALGWVNRDHDPVYLDCFWLWSNAGNIVRFIMRQKVVETGMVVEDGN